MSNTTATFPDVIVDTDWLERHIDEPGVRVFDCTTHLIHQSDPGVGAPYLVQSGRSDYELGHIPGAAFIDLQQDLSDTSSPYRFSCLPAAELGRQFSRLGIGDNISPVLYSQTSPQWATRIWWLLHSIGFDRARVLNGGLTRWKLDGRSLSVQQTVHSETPLTVNPRPDALVDKNTVLSAIDQHKTCTINALRRSQHAGTDEGEFGHYGRPGRIPGSVNLPTVELVDPTTMEFLAAEEIRARLDALGASDASRVITYCGGGIAASATAMLLVLLGHQNVGLYDASLSEWAIDATLPMQTDG